MWLRSVVMCYLVVKIRLVYYDLMCFFFLMIRRPPRSTLGRSAAASEVDKRQIYKYPIFCAKHIKKRTEMLIKNNNIKRLQTSVKADCEMAIRFAKWLGLNSEGLMKNYGPDGEDFIRFARIER